MLKADRDQLCAEAICAFLSYEPWHITGQAAESQELAAGKRSEEDPRAWVLGLLGDVTDFSARRVLDLLGNEKDDHDKADAQRVGGMLQGAQWEKEGKFKARGQGGSERGPRRSWIWHRDHEQRRARSEGAACEWAYHAARVVGGARRAEHVME